MEFKQTCSAFVPPRIELLINDADASPQHQSPLEETFTCRWKFTTVF